MTRKQRKNSPRRAQVHDYNELESRCLLAVDIGINLTGATYQTDSTFYPANATSDVGPDHIVEVLSGRVNIYNKTTGTPIRSTTLDNFFVQAGGFVPNTTQNPNVIYDQLSGQWFVVAGGNNLGNWIHLAFTDSPDAGGVWRTLQFVGDSTRRSITDEVTLAVDADAIYMTTNNSGPIVGDSVSIFSIPKVDLQGPNPTLTNMSRFESLDPTVYGRSIQVASNYEASDGRARALGTIRGTAGETLMVQTDIVGAGTAAATLDGPWIIGDDILREFYFPFATLEPPQVRQPFRDGMFPEDETGYEWPIEHNRTELNGSIIETDGGLWAAFTVSYSTLAFPVPVVGVHWFEVDPVLHQVRLTEGDAGGYNMGIIADGIDEDGDQQIDRDYFNPVFHVNEFGVVVLSYNGSGFVDDGDTLRNHLPSNYVSVGVTTNGKDARRTQFDPAPDFPHEGAPPFETHAGLENYEIEFPSPWARYASVRFDPTNKNSFVMTRQWANTVDRWSTQVAEVRPVDLTPRLFGDNGNNTFVIRRAMSPDGYELMEIEIDGVVTDQIPYDVLGRVRLMGLAGADRFIIDYSNGDPLELGQLIIDGGAGPDVVQSENPGLNEWVVIPTDFDRRDIFDVTPEVDFGEGTLNGTTDFVHMEELWGGPGPDHFLVTEIFPPDPLDPRDPGYLDGSLLGRGGDDIFEFAHRGAIGDSVNGGPGYNTLVFTDRAFDTNMELTGFGAEAGFNGRTLGPIGQGPIGGDQTTDQFRDISQIIGANVNYIGNGNRIYDTLDMLPGVASEWLIDDENSTYTANGVTMNFWQVDELSASNLDDTFNAISNTMDPIVLNGLGGNDTYNFSSDAPVNTGITDNLQGLIVANAGTGVNTMNVSHMAGQSLDALIVAARISGMGEITYTTDPGGVFNLNVWGSNEPDQFRLHSFLKDNTLNLYSLNGNDEFDIQDLSKAFVTVFGGEGDDIYTIQRIQGVSFRNLSIVDSIDAEMDRVQLAGTILNETFTITDTTFDDLEVAYTGIEFFGIDGRGGNDTINIQSSPLNLYVSGGDGNDVINVSSDAGLNNGSLMNLPGTVYVDGGTGNNRLNISYESDGGRNVTIMADRMVGLTGGPLYYLSPGGNFYGDFLSEGIQIEGSQLGADNFEVKGMDPQHRMRIQTFGGGDRITVRGSVFADLVLDGGEDPDFYKVFLNGQVNRVVTIRDRSDLETNRLDVFGTTEADEIAISPIGLGNGGELVHYLNANLHFLGVAGNDGDDVITLNDSPAITTHLFGSRGNDTINIDNTDSINGVRAVGFDGNDIFNLNQSAATTFVRMVGGNDDDTFNVATAAEGSVLVNGQEGSDSYNINMSPTLGRWISTRDSGTTGVDHTTAFGTSGMDTMEIRSQRVLMNGETVVFDSNTEIVTADGAGGNDTLTLFASNAAETQMAGGLGDDSINVRSTAGGTTIVTTMGGLGNDTTDVRNLTPGLVMTAYGDEGDDSFIVGSTMAENNGNLNRLRGRLNIVGGANGGGEDSLYINDALLSVPYSYFSNGSSIKAIPGPLGVARPLFAGIFFDETLEFAQLDATQGQNHFSVKSSEGTRFHYNGNDPAGVPNGDFIQLLNESGDGHELTITDPVNGDGFWTFTNGDQNISFENMEGWYNPPLSIIFWPGEPGGSDDGDSDYAPPAMAPVVQDPDDLMTGEILPDAFDSIDFGDDLFAGVSDQGDSDTFWMELDANEG